MAHDGGHLRKLSNPENWDLHPWKAQPAQGPVGGDVRLHNRGPAGHSHRGLAEKFLPRKVMMFLKRQLEKVEKNEIPSNPIHKSKFEMDQRPECKS